MSLVNHRTKQAFSDFAGSLWRISGELESKSDGATTYALIWFLLFSAIFIPPALTTLLHSCLRGARWIGAAADHPSRLLFNPFALPNVPRKGTLTGRLQPAGTNRSRSCGCYVNSLAGLEGLFDSVSHIGWRRLGDRSMQNLSNSEKNVPGSSDRKYSAGSAMSSMLKIVENVAHQASVYGIAAGYCISASLLSIINKWAVMKFPYPGALTALQYFTSAFGVLICGWLKILDHDRLELHTLWKFLPAAVIFYLSLFTNSELLLHANVDTFIVFRSAVPILVAVGEAIYLKQPWPSIHTWISLATIFSGSVIYVMTDYQFTVTAYSWALAYLVSMTIDFVYIKHVVMTIGLNTWGLVLYNNLEALMLFPLELLITGELKKIKHEITDESDWHTISVVLPVGLSCLFGLAISFFGFSCRRAISATGFTVLGIVNKLLTVIINLVIWDKHSTFVGTIGLLICMAGGVLYQQSTKKPKSTQKETTFRAGDEEQQKLLEMQGPQTSSRENQGTATG